MNMLRLSRACPTSGEFGIFVENFVENFVDFRPFSTKFSTKDSLGQALSMKPTQPAIEARCARLFCAVLLLLAALAPQARAATREWDGSATGNWGASANWTAGTAPGNGDDVVFPPGAANLANTNNFP